MDSPPAVALAVEGSQAPVLFRAAKRRKITRTHSPTAGDEDDHTVESTSQALVILDESAGAEGSIAEANAVGIQLRRPMRRRLGGIIVSTEPSRSTSPFTAARDENNTQEGEQLQSLSRFVKPTGQIATSDKHMAAYIDQELARRRDASQVDLQDDEQLNQRTEYPADSDTRPRQPTGVGRLEEVDIGPDLTAKRTEKPRFSRRKLNGKWITVARQPPPQPQPPGKGPGLPPPPAILPRPFRPRNRRGSQDIARDSLVEQILAASTLNIYETPAAPNPSTKQSTSTTTTNPQAAPDRATDDLVAEAFVRNYLEAQTNRRQRMPAPTITSSGAKGPGAKKEDERAARRGGPKLGGSRSARAAMRQMEIAAEKVAVAEREAAVEKRGRKGR